MRTQRSNARLHRVTRTVLSGAIASASLLNSMSLYAAPAGSRDGSRTAIVARSTDATAATDRKPISVRIASARQPIRIAEPSAGRTVPAEQHAEPVAGPPHDSPNPLEQPTPQEPVAGLVDAKPAAEPDTVVPAAFPDPEVLESRASVAPVMVDGLLYPPSVVVASGANEPARLAAPAVTLQITESPTKAAQGGAIDWRLELCNVGSEPATDVTAVLFFAEGIEPVAASGAAASLAAGEVRFEPLETLKPGEIVELLVTGVGTGSGNVRYRAEVVSYELENAISQDGVVEVSQAQGNR